MYKNNLYIIVYMRKNYKLTHAECKKYDSELPLTFDEFKYNNIVFSPTDVTNFRITYNVIRKINLLNDHQVEKRQFVDSRNQVKDIYMHVEPKPILLHINSNELIRILDALPLMDTILLSSISINTIIDGVCRDAMLLPFIVGKKRFMYKHSHVYITNFFYEQGTGSTIEDKMINITTFRNRITNIFKKYTKLSDEIYKSLFKREIFFNAEDCLKFGIVDHII